VEAAEEPQRLAVVVDLAGRAAVLGVVGDDVLGRVDNREENSVVWVRVTMPGLRSRDRVARYAVNPLVG